MSELEPITATDVTAEQIDALHAAVEALERAAGLPTERELVLALVEDLPKCSICGAVATHYAWWSGHVGRCDAHRTGSACFDVDYAPALRALLARMATWPTADAAVPVVAANDGGST